MFGTKERVRRREICWKTGLARLEPVQLPMPALGHAFRQSLTSNIQFIANLLAFYLINPIFMQNPR